MESVFQKSPFLHIQDENLTTLINIDYLTNENFV